jgi:FAD:protein FMN transferase
VSAVTGTRRTATEYGETFACFGGRCGVWVTPGPATPGSDRALSDAKRRLLAWHRRFTRFDRSSELSRLNADPRVRVPVSQMMARFIEAALGAARMTDGLVDPTLLGQIERAGYTHDHEGSLPLELSLGLTVRRAPAAPSAASRFGEVRLCDGGRMVERPPGVRLDSGGIVKGLFADTLGESLADTAGYGVDCAGDLRVGGSEGMSRLVGVASPFGEEVLHEYELRDGGIATSGISRRSWLDDRGCPAHHLLDPSTGRAAFTGVVQATALAPSALEAEIRAKAAVLSGPERAMQWLPHGGVIVYDDGDFSVVQRCA